MAFHSPPHLDLIEGFIADTLNESQQQQLAEWLRTDEQARQLYLEYMDLHTALHWTLQWAPQRRDQLSSHRDHESPALPATIALREGSESQVSTSRPPLFHFAPIWTMAGVFALGILTMFAVSRWSAPKPELAKAAPLDWPLQASVLHIDSGSATLALPKVGYVVLEGPADLEMLDPMRARLKQGRIRVRVTEPTGYGFVVEYPDGKVTDLGTEFGLSVPPAGSGQARTSLVVFDGAVDLERSAAKKQPVESAHVDRLVRGEGVTFRADGQLDRIMSIVTGKVATFQPGSEMHAEESDLIILDVTDNLRTSDTKKFYEIVPGGFVEDALAYVDRPEHQWNGLTKKGIPKHLVGGDYIKTFSDDKWRTDVEISVTLRCPAKLYVLYDDRLKPPEWLKSDFRKTKHYVGRDLGPWPTIDKPVETDVGPGKSIDHRFEVWERVVKEPGVVRLGANGRLGLDGKPSIWPHMYGIAAVALDAPNSVAIIEDNDSVFNDNKSAVGSRDSL